MAGKKVAIAIGIAIAVIVIIIAGVLIALHHRAVGVPQKVNATTVQRPKVKVVTRTVTKVKIGSARAVLAWETPPLISRSWLIKNGIYYRAWSWWSYFQGYVTVSPNGKYVIVGTVKGELYIYNASTGSLIKEITFPLGEIPRTIRFTADGRYMIVGVWSRKGWLIIYDTRTWTPVARLELDKYVAGPSNATIQTIIKEPWLAVIPYYAVVSPNGDIVYVTIVERYVNPKTQSPEYIPVKYDLAEIYPQIREKYKHYPAMVWVDKYYWSRVIAYDIATHRVVWVWPRDHPAYVDIPILAISSNGKYLAAASFWGIYAKNPVEWHMGEVWVLDAATGKLLYTYSPLPPIPYMNHTSIWNGLAFADDGKYLTVVTGEGRIVVLDNERSVIMHRPVVVWEKDIVEFIPTQAFLIPLTGKAKTAKIVKTYIYTYAGLAAVTSRYLIAYTGGTYCVGWTPGYLKRPEIVHPNSTKLFIFDLQTGKLVYVDLFNGMPTYGKVRPFVLTGCYLVGSIGVNWVRADASMAGVYVWYVCGTPHRVLRILTVLRGLGIPADVSAYDSMIYVLTGLVNTAHSPTQPAHIVGEYRLIAYRIVIT
ncbi:MAG: hypothetical protein GXO10_06310 [Crenarchaeota archaeon]|nr:hypothetical protein [Thermoproteota archaeon]